MRASALLLAVLMVTAGCVGKAESVGPAPSASAAEKTQDTGGIQGHIVTDEIQPIANAQVALQGTNKAATSAADGGFSFSTLDPGEYVVLVGALGYFATGKKVSVRAGEVSGAEIILDRIPIADPAFVETFKFEDTLLLNDACPTAPEMTPGTQGITWQDYPLTINASKEDGTPLAAVSTFVDLKSREDAATIDIDLYLLDAEGKQLASSASGGPNENLSIEKILQPGKYTIRACLWTGANSHYVVTVTVTYEQGEAALFALKGKK